MARRASGDCTRARSASHSACTPSPARYTSQQAMRSWDCTRSKWRRGELGAHRAREAAVAPEAADVEGVEHDGRAVAARASGA